MNRSASDMHENDKDDEEVEIELNEVTAAKHDKALFKAVKLNDKNKVEKYLCNGTNVNDKDELGRTALHWACRRGHLEIVEVLLRYEANTEVKEPVQKRFQFNSVPLLPFGNTPLQLAMAYKKIDIVEFLLEHGAEVEKISEGGTAFWAVLNNFIGVMEILLNRGVGVNSPLQQQDEGVCALHLAVEVGHLELCEMLLDSGANINQSGPGMWTPLHCAAHNGHLDILRLLLSRGAFVDIKNNAFNKSALKDCIGMTPLHAAVWGSRNLHHRPIGEARISIVIELLNKSADAGAAFEFIGNKDFSLIGLAAYTGNVKMARLLINRNIGIDVLMRADSSPLFIAIDQRKNSMVSCLMEHHILHGACLQSVSKDGFSLKQYAEVYGSSTLVMQIRSFFKKHNLAF